ncbi:MAG: IS91 family transposase [Pirellulaceae bacterium]
MSRKMIASTTHRERQRVHQARCAGARRAVHQQVAEDGEGPPANPPERGCQTPESQVLRRELPPLRTPAPPATARLTRVSSSSPLAAIHAAQSARDQEEELSAAWRPKLDLAEVFRTFGPEYRRQCGDRLSVQQDRVLRELMVCRTQVLGSHQWACERCGQQVELFNSSKNRHCPKCGRHDREKWAAQVQADLLPIPYVHVVLTLPEQLTELAFAHPTVLYPLLLRAGAEAILQLAREELEAELAVLILLHTWGQLMNRHVHGHCLVSGGGLWLHGERFIQLKSGAFLSLDKLACVLRERYLKKLDSLYRRGELVLEGDWRQLERGQAWQQWLEPLRHMDWVVFIRSVWDRREKEGKKSELAKAIEYLVSDRKLPQRRP